MRALLAVIALASLARAEPCGDRVACAEDYFFGKHGAPVDTQKSFAYAKAACDAGDAHGCALLGFHYQDGVGVEQAPERAIATYDKACRGGSGVACFNLAGMYGGGHGVIVDHAKYEAYKKLAREQWTAACDRGHTASCTALASMMLADSDRKRAIALCDRACAASDRNGCVQAARLRFEDKALAAAAYLKELDAQCTAGEASGCGTAGSALLAGTGGIAKDRARGLALATRGCDGGDANACMDLLVDAYDAKDVAKQRAYAAQACDRHAVHGCVVAAAIAADVKTADAFDRRACLMGNAEACETLARSMFAAKRDGDAIRWVREACRMGRGLACGVLIERDLDVPVPPDAKKKLYAEACKADIKPACRHR